MDGQNKQIMTRFAAACALSGLFAARAPAEVRMAFLASCLLLAALASATLALLKRQPPMGDLLTHWDQAALFLGASHTVRMFAGPPAAPPS